MPAAHAQLSRALLDQLQTALNNGDTSALASLAGSSDEIGGSELETRYRKLRDQFPNSQWTLAAGKDLADGRNTLKVNVVGNGSQEGRDFRLEASQTLAVRSDGLTLGSQEVLAEESIVRSGERDLEVSVLAPDTVLTGQRYDLDVLMDEPLKDATLAGGLTELTAADLLQEESPEIELGALNAGGIFKTIQAPYQSGRQAWAALLLHPEGTVSISRTVRVVNRL
tara:strand:- start:1185 stop:1859 length:675 start_codon:yes stop_codon:yes gene_type:complete